MKKERKIAAIKRSNTKKAWSQKKQVEADFMSRYPICGEVKSFLDTIEPYLDDDQLGILTDSFLGFSADIQREMLCCILLNIVHGDIEQTGVTHIDLLLCDMRDLIYEAIVLPALPVLKTVCKYSEALLEAISLMEERRTEWKKFKNDYCKLLEGTYRK